MVPRRIPNMITVPPGASVLMSDEIDCDYEDYDAIVAVIMDKVILGNEILNLARFQDWVIAMLVDEVKKLDHVPTVEALETSLKDGFMKAIVFIVGPSSSSNFASKAIENFMQLVPFIFPALLTKLLEAEVAIVVSEEAKRTYRATKLDAAREVDGCRGVEVDAPAVATYGSMATLAEPTQAFRYKKMMTESELAAILRAVDKVPLSKPPFTGFGDNRSLSAFKVEITDTVRRRHWSAVHEFHYLSRALEGSLWLLVTVQLFNDLNPQSYVVALEQVWANLDKVCGGQLEQEQLLNTMIDLKQSSDESLSSFLGRVTRFRSQCRASGAMQMRDDSYYMMLSRRGMSSGVVASQAASITCESWIEWVRQVIMIDQRLSSSKPSPSSSPSKIPGQTSTATTPEVQQVAPVRAVDFGVRPDVSQFSNVPSPQTTGQQSHRPNRRGPKKCFTCGKSDHLTKQCPLRRCWNCLSVGHSASECPKSSPANPKSGSGTEAVRVVGSTEGTVHSDERGETVILPSRSVVIRAWGDTHKLDGGILTATYGGKLVLKGLVDTGATDALLSKSVYDQIREHCPEVPSLIPCQATATLANGSTEEVVGTVKLDLIFCDRVVTHDYYVVKDLQPGDSAEGLRVTTRVKSSAEGDSEGITQPGIVTSLNADSEEIAVRKVRRVKTPFRVLLILLLYILSSLLAVMRWSSIGDRYQQHHSMTIGWPPLKPRTDGTHVDYSKAMIARLSDEQKELLRKEQSLLKSTRLQPVCDARSWNSILPSASYLGSDTSVLLTEMQLAINKLLLDGLSDTPRPGIESEPFPWRYQSMLVGALYLAYRAVTKSQERTSIGRLLVIASDVRVRLQLPVVVRHIAAEINADADDLSRLAQLWDLPLDDLFNSQRSGEIGVCIVHALSVVLLCS
ncbi:hypothetical protein FOZ60_007082 [Perkinsus olseni]|uniref:CCHC-type domain-containing protein n=1 Tax=Perkinsus olseni TaxID=32597 RepID=A0A7J6NM58_PEROL|nr:hypothetical protein FOZ60_007082 [Perkinsus olseni]